MENPLDWFLVFDSFPWGGRIIHTGSWLSTKFCHVGKEKRLRLCPRWYTEIGWKLGEEARIYIVNSVTSLEIGSQSTNFRHISYASIGTACATREGEMEVKEGGRRGIAKDLRETRSSYVTISVPNIKPINFKHLSRFVWTKPRVCSLFPDVFFFLLFSFHSSLSRSIEILLLLLLLRINVCQCLWIFSDFFLHFCLLLLGNIGCWYISLKSKQQNCRSCKNIKR